MLYVVLYMMHGHTYIRSVTLKCHSCWYV